MAGGSRRSETADGLLSLDAVHQTVVHIDRGARALNVRQRRYPQRLHGLRPEVGAGQLPVGFRRPARAAVVGHLLVEQRVEEEGEEGDLEGDGEEDEDEGEQLEVLLAVDVPAS